MSHLARRSLLVLIVAAACVSVGPLVGPGALASSTGTTADATTGVISTAVIVATFADSTTAVDMDAIKTTFRGNPGHDAVSYFSEASYGRATLAPAFFGPYTLTTSSAGCAASPTQALIAAAAADVTFSQFSRLVFVYNCPGTTFGSATSVGALSTPQGTVQAAQIALDAGSATNLYSVVHELSHTLGAFNSHAAFYVCLPETLIAPSRSEAGCVSGEYGDSFDVLGGGPTHMVSQLNPYHKAKAGWFGAGQFPTLDAPGTYTYTLAPYEEPAGAVLALNIPRGPSGTALTVEYRQAVGFDSWMASPVDCPRCTVTQGASIRLVTGGGGAGGGSDTQLLDTTPGTIPSSFYYPVEDAVDGALLPGRTFVDPEFGISITAVSADSSGLTVKVTVPSQTCVRRTPTVSAPSPSTQTGTIDTAGVYAVTVTNGDSAGCAANIFRYLPPSSSSMSVVGSPDFLTLEPGASATISLAVRALPLTTAGSFTFASSDGVGAGIVRSDSLGTGNAVISGLTYQLGSAADATAPAAPGGLTATPLGARAVGLSWSPSTDAVGAIGYRVTRSGAQMTTGDTSLVDTGLGASATYAYSVQAFDRRGNLSPATTVSVTTPPKTDFAAPTSPVVTAAAGDRSISVSWSESRDDLGVAYYRISPCLIPRCLVPASVRSFTVDELPTRTRYDFQVLAVDGDGNTSDFAFGTYTVYTGASGGTPPSQPRHLISPAGRYLHVDLAWEPGAAGGLVDHYVVYRNNRRIGSVTSPSFTDNVVIASSQYYVQAVGADGSLSAPSPRVWFPAPSSASADSSPPSARVTSPASEATVAGTSTVIASADDNVRVTRVELYVDGVYKATSTTYPHAFAWDTTTAGNGDHWLYVRAYDAAGNHGSTGIVEVTVDNGAGPAVPTVSIVSPQSGPVGSGTVVVTAAASDSVGVQDVQFAVDGVQVATSTTAPYGFAWDASVASVGSHTITATAHNAAGKAAKASVVVMRSAPPDTTPPTVSITAPTSGATVGGTIALQASALDAVGVATVELFVDGALSAALTSSPWIFALDTSTLGSGAHTLAVKAYDAAGNSAGAQISVSVAPADAVAPTAASSLRAAVVGTTQTALSWAAAKDNVAVVAYEVLRDGVVIGQPGARYFVDQGLAPGSSHSYRVVALDAAGNRSAPTSALSARTAGTSTATTATVAGLVYSLEGKPLANAVVQVTVNGAVKSAKTSSTGIFKLSSLPAAPYTVTASLVGYQTTTAGVTAPRGQTTVLALVLSP
jgi:chitodextrinase